MSEDDGKGKWLWGALGLAAGAGLAYWLIKRKNALPASRSPVALPQSVPVQSPDAGTEGMMAAYAAQQGVRGPDPDQRTGDVVDAEFEKVEEDEQQEF
jgi:hypothetical protein